MKYTTLKEFFAQLEQVKSHYIWTVENGGDIRGQNFEEFVCPVTAVAKVIHDQDYDVGDFMAANNSCVHLTGNVMNAVTDAADCFFMEREGRVALRNRLLQILELKEIV